LHTKGQFMNSYVIWGMGLLGTSLALDLKKLGCKVAGIEKSREYIEVLQKYKFDKIYHTSDDFQESLRSCDGIIIATPVDAVYEILEQIAGASLPENTWITDMASTKGELMKKASHCSKNMHFVGSHPMTGSDLNGPAHARMDLFAGATIYVTPLPQPQNDMGNLSDRILTENVCKFWKSLGAHPYEISSEIHDKWAAYLSHGLHLVSCMVSCLLNDIPEVLEMSHPPAGGSFRDITRVAGSNPELWSGIINSNSKEVTAYLESMERLIGDWKRQLQEKNLPVKEIFMKSARIRSAIVKNK